MQQLEFKDYYKTLKFTDNGQVQNYDLSEAGKAVKVAWENGAFAVSTIERPENAKMGFEVPGTDLSFDAGKLGGTVIIDLRDIERYANDEYTGEVKIEFDLECTVHTFWYKPESPKWLMIQFPDEDCHTITS